MSELPEPACQIFIRKPRTSYYSIIYRVVGYVDFFFDENGDFDGIEFTLPTDPNQRKLAVELLQVLAISLNVKGEEAMGR